MSTHRSWKIPGRSSPICMTARVSGEQYDEAAASVSAMLLQGRHLAQMSATATRDDEAFELAGKLVDLSTPLESVTEDINLQGAVAHQVRCGDVSVRDFLIVSPPVLVRTAAGKAHVLTLMGWICSEPLDLKYLNLLKTKYDIIQGKVMQAGTSISIGTCSQKLGVVLALVIVLVMVLVVVWILLVVVLLVFVLIHSMDTSRLATRRWPAQTLVSQS